MTDTCADLPTAGTADLVLVLWFAITGIAMIFGTKRTAVASTRLAFVLVPLVVLAGFASVQGSIMCDPERYCCTPVDKGWFAWAPAIVGLCFYTFIHAMRLVQPSRIFAVIATGWALVFPVAAYFNGMSGPTAFAIGIAVFFDLVLIGIKKILIGNQARAEFENNRTSAHQECNRELLRLRWQWLRGKLPSGSYRSQAKKIKEMRTQKVDTFKWEYKTRKKAK